MTHYEHLFNASQQNKGILTQKTIESYSKQAFTSIEEQKKFLDYTKLRLGYLSYLDLLNDTSEGNRFYEEKICLMDGDKTVEHIMKIRINYRYEVNTGFYKYYQAYQKLKSHNKKDSFNFSNVHIKKEKALKEFVPGKGYRHLLEFAKD